MLSVMHGRINSGLYGSIGPRDGNEMARNLQVAAGCPVPRLPLQWRFYQLQIPLKSRHANTQDPSASQSRYCSNCSLSGSNVGSRRKLAGLAGAAGGWIERGEGAADGLERDGEYCLEGSDSWCGPLVSDHLAGSH